MANRFTFFLVGGGVRPIGFAIILVGGDVQQKAYGASAARKFFPCRRYFLEAIGTPTVFTNQNIHMLRCNLMAKLKHDSL